MDLISFWYQRKSVVTRLGYVADFCPICHEATPSAIERLGMSRQIYGVTLNQGKLVGHERICLSCGCVFQGDPGKYASISPKFAFLPELQAATLPNLEHIHRDQLALARRIRDEPQAFSAEERHALIRNVMLSLSIKAQRHSRMNIDRNTGLALIGTVLWAMFGSSVLPMVPIGFFWLSGLGIVLWQFISSRRRAMRREVLPTLARGLRPLKPEPAEIQAVLAELKRQRHPVGIKVDAGDLLRLL